MITLQLSRLNPDVLKMAAIFFVVSLIIMFVFKGTKKLLSKKRKQLILYILITMAVTALLAFLGSERVLNDIPLHIFIGIQVGFLALGIIHVLVSRQHFKLLSENPGSFWSEIIFTCVVLMIGLVSFVLVLNLFKADYTFTYLGAAIWHLVPVFLVKTYEFSMLIPLPVYKKWMYPVGKYINDPKDEELVNPQVISFEFHKSERTEELTNFRLKAPEKMEFGKLFYFFINDYNLRHPESVIEYVDDKNKPHGWIFYKRPKWYLPMKYIDHARTVDSNGISEDDVIICNRVTT